jgi:NifU-like protein involved in Fe-S cluster formation
MSGETDLIKLYSGRILALAADIPFHERLSAPDASVRKRSPVCGSTVTVDLKMEAGKVAQFGQDVKACALGQAAASILAQNVIGRSACELIQLKSELHAMLKEGAQPPKAPFHAFEVLQPARDFKNRHASIMLSIEAAAEAAEMALASPVT